MKTGTAHLPLHTGKAPHWLFQRMKGLAREIVVVMLADFGSVELMKRLSDPFWFQAWAACWASTGTRSGVTTTVCGALKEGLKARARARALRRGGKGRVSAADPATRSKPRRAPRCPSRQPLVYASRMSAKVDSAAVQDGYQIYHHVFIFTPTGRVGGGAAGDERREPLGPPLPLARDRGGHDFVCEPHAAVCCDRRGNVLNLVAGEGEQNRKGSAELIYGAKPSFRDPARFSYAHGGKDGHPYPVDREVYDRSIHFLRETVNSARIDASEKKEAFRRLSAFYPVLPAQDSRHEHACRRCRRRRSPWWPERQRGSRSS